jgi:hypothetical protein
MKITTYNGERNLTDLAHRLFEIKGAGAKTRTQEIEAALLAANPHLSDLKQVAEGTPIVIPSFEVEATPKESGSTAATLIRQIREQLDGLGKSLNDSVKQRAKELAATKEIMKDRDFKRLIKSTPGTAERLKQIAGNASDELEKLDQLKENQEKGMSQLEKDLDTFIKRFF